MINKIKNMAKLAIQYFRVQNTDGSTSQMPASEIIEALKAYKAQNPKKYAQKKEALFARYGIGVEEAPAVEAVIEDEGDIELEELAKKATKATKATKKAK